MTIRLRLTLWYTALLGATLIFFSVVVYSALSTNLSNQQIEDSERQANVVAVAIAEQLEQAARGDVDQIEFPDLNYFATGVGVQVIGLDGTLIKQSNNLMNMAVPGYKQALYAITRGFDHQYTTTQGGEPLLVYSSPVIVAGSPYLGVQIVRPLGAAQSALAQVNRYLVLGTGLSLIVAAVVGAFLARRELQPLAEISRTASSINHAQDLELRLSPDDPDSEIGELAVTFNDMLDRIQSLFKGQERLTADVSHELRTPLTTIQGNMELLQRMTSGERPRLQGSEENVTMMREIVDETENEATRMSKMINDLLLLAQADSGVLRLKMEPVEMDTLLLDVYRQTRRIAEMRMGQHAQEIRLGTEDQALALGDPERLRQVLVNLTDNAIKYTPAGGVITLSLENRDGWVKVAVSDTGIGISPEQQQHIFDRFYRTDKARSREQGGSGLGLSIVSWLAQAHNGRVTVESELGRGSTFTLWLPEYLPSTPGYAYADVDFDAHTDGALNEEVLTEDALSHGEGSDSASDDVEASDVEANDGEDNDVEASDVDDSAAPEPLPPPIHTTP